MVDQIADLEDRLCMKQRDLSEMIGKYSILDQAVITDQLVNQSMYNSRSGVPAEYITNKVVHDVLVKSIIRSGSHSRKY